MQFITVCAAVMHCTAIWNATKCTMYCKTLLLTIVMKSNTDTDYQFVEFKTAIDFHTLPETGTD